MRRLVCLLLACLSLSTPRAALAADALRFHYPDSGAPPWLFLTPGASRPTGVVADILEGALRDEGLTVRYEFQPRESASGSLESGTADGALFFSATRPPRKGVALTDPLLGMTSVLVTPRGKPLRYNRPSDLADVRLCTLTEEIYPPLTLLAMNGKLLLRKAKTEQAQLMMLRNEDCSAAIVNGPMYHWLATRYRWDDLEVEGKPLLDESLVIGFAPKHAGLVAAVNRHVARLRRSGELDALVSRYLPGRPQVGTR